ncbi:hypothetical protein K0504_01855 [Neiella marina]|uniref:LAGLIDADG homing endonuclease n=1 Tax=Neiella holothuriorum TaxID=2870530 RepID=A0ABS7EC35_9GAMM|nr:hypothetical protein [Neiella holothuriorum]MBW8189764.1 hypothetical protein [Neiella holothuriorum]
MFDEQTMLKVANWYSRQGKRTHPHWLPKHHFGSLETVSVAHIQTHDSIWIICCLLLLNKEHRSIAISEYSKIYYQKHQCHPVSYQKDGMARKIANAHIRQFVCKKQGTNSAPNLCLQALEKVKSLTKKQRS